MFYSTLSFILKKLAKPLINKFQPKIIGVTGSVGKTSTKEAIYYILNSSSTYHGKIVWSGGGLNTEVGLPLAILGFNKPAYGVEWISTIVVAFTRFIKYMLTNNYPELLVLEYAADKPGDIEYLISIVKPHIAVITEIGPAHLAQFRTVENVAKEKIKLAQNLQADGIAVLNEDNKYIKAYAKYIYFKKVFYHGDTFDSSKNAARAVGKIMGLKDEEINSSLETLPKVAGRLQEFAGIKNTTIIDDSYNSNPISLARALEYLKKKKTKGKKIVILGDMRELGSSSATEHAKIAKRICHMADLAILIGPEMQNYAVPVFEKVKFPHFAFDSFTASQKTILDNITENDLILVKGSQNTLFLERVVEMLLRDKSDKSKLCRQGKFWYNIKHNTP